MESLLKLHHPHAHFGSKQTKPISHVVPKSTFLPRTHHTFVPPSPIRTVSYRPLQVHASSSSAPSTFHFRHSGKIRVDESKSLTLPSIRHSLIRQEDSIIFGLLERAQYAYNGDTYDHDALVADGFRGSLVEYMVCETEKLHAQVGRYMSPDEHAFFPEYLPEPLLPPLKYPQVLHPCANSININKLIWDMYFKDLLPRLVEPGDDGNCGSAAVCDTLCLQALSKRIHYGKFVAEAKFLEYHELYEPAIKAKDGKRLMQLLTDESVEVLVHDRVEKKSRTFGQVVEINGNGEVVDPDYKIEPGLIGNLYVDWIMPLTKQVQVEYLLRRLD
ncbi:chorismate mutase 3, chloroplastic-like isoform X1 [Vicia villosa]|uniref:chorismate mutase 3, chloroplastic-like isoform X1 n=1 Tax=Vicia villosa TaxID=3911 RepID=UPI00273CD088|nr:chorismate mutase 3, chloroplastic-like isoform X1 [Vicia villosa]